MRYTLLTLGDSYTIGEGVPLSHSFPYHTISLLRAAGRPFTAPEILAVTGWTTDNLMSGIAARRLLPEYDFVSLLIGVNNQYQGKSVESFMSGFPFLLRESIRLAGGHPAHAFVFSIPDWSVSPFAATHLPDPKGRDRAAVAREIDAFNAAARKEALSKGVAFIDITTHSRSFAVIPEGLSPFAADGLHPSRLQYEYWAEKLVEKILERLV